jgi:predicted ester cyclase
MFLGNRLLGPRVCDLETYKGFIAEVRTSFPDFRVTNEDMIAERDKVASRWTARGTHQGAFIGIPPTGRQATWTTMTIHRFAGSKIVEAWWNKDILKMLIQLGVVPQPGQGEE